MDVLGYRPIRWLSRYAKGIWESGSAPRQDTIIYVVTVKTVLVKGAFVETG